MADTKNVSQFGNNKSWWWLLAVMEKHRAPQKLAGNVLRVMFYNIQSMHVHLV